MSSNKWSNNLIQFLMLTSFLLESEILKATKHIILKICSIFLNEYSLKAKRPVMAVALKRRGLKRLHHQYQLYHDFPIYSQLQVMYKDNVSIKQYLTETV